jgi:hypothetical protein
VLSFFSSGFGLMDASTENAVQELGKRDTRLMQQNYSKGS